MKELTKEIYDMIKSECDESHTVLAPGYIKEFGSFDFSRSYSIYQGRYK